MKGGETTLILLSSPTECESRMMGRVGFTETSSGIRAPDGELDSEKSTEFLGLLTAVVSTLEAFTLDRRVPKIPMLNLDGFERELLAGFASSFCVILEEAPTVVCLI